MNLSVHTEEEYNALCRILDRKNIKYRVKDFELNIEVDENLAEYREHCAKELEPTFDELFFEVIRKLENGRFFFFGSYKGAPIKWLKVSKYRAISAYILDNMAFGDNNNYGTSKVRAWCNDLGAEYGLGNDDIYIPSEKEILCWFPTDELRKCDYSDEAKSRGIDDSAPWFWTKNLVENTSDVVRYVHSSGSFYSYYTHNSYIGVRPVLKI